MQNPLLFAGAILALGVIGCERQVSLGGSPDGSAPWSNADAGGVALPTVRLYLMTDVAGALEPCGCIMDQRGGFDHLAAWMQRERARAPASLVAAAGPLFFMDDALQPDRAAQDHEKAAAMASILGALHLDAFAPGINDWNDGEAGLIDLARRSGGAIVPSSATGQEPPFASAIVKGVGGIKVGFVGFGQGPTAPPTAGATDPAASVARGVHLAEEQGASVLVALVAVGRDEAKRIAAAVPELTAIVVGAPRESGEENTSAPQAERVGDVLLAQGANHLQTLAVLDLYVRDRVTPGQLIRFADATGLERSRERESLATRVDDLHVKISIWERDRTLSKADLEARKAELSALEEERVSLDVKPPPARGSFFRYSLEEVRPSLGTDPKIRAQMDDYYRVVNMDNQSALAGRMPAPRVAGHAGYVGIAVCARCHAPAARMWMRTWHANAYGTLQAEAREFNLECVGCHVTGYGRPGGSTVTHADALHDVQCEVCHGPGSRHVADPTDATATIAKPDAKGCLACHRPPHVEDFDPIAKMKEIVGPGHGMPLNQ